MLNGGDKFGEVSFLTKWTLKCTTYYSDYDFPAVQIGANSLSSPPSYLLVRINWKTSSTLSLSPLSSQLFLLVPLKLLAIIGVADWDCLIAA